MAGKVDLWQHPETKRWYITWTVDGRSLRRSTRKTDRGDAQQVLAAFLLEAGATVPVDELKVATLLDSYYERHAQHLPSATQAAIAIRSLKAFYGDAAVTTITQRNHERYIAECKAQVPPLANGTINQRLTRLRSALKFAVRSGDLIAAPFVPILPEPPPRADALQRRQIAALIRAARELDYEHVVWFIRLAFYTGARKSAILQLTWDRVDLEAGTVDFRLPGINHSRKKRALTGLPHRLLASLRHAARRTNSPMVITYEGAPVANIKRAWKTVATAAGMPEITPHILKHTAVSQALPVVAPWIAAGMFATSLRTLQRVYGKHMAADLKAGAEAMARASVTRKQRANREKSSVPGKRDGGKKKPSK